MSRKNVRPHGRVLITGGAGFIGSHLAEALVECGDRVTVLDDLSTGSADNVSGLDSHPRFELVRGTVTDHDVVERLVAGSDAVVHLAAAVGVDLIVRRPVHAIETNVLGTQAVLRAADRHGTRVLLASSSEVYGKNENVPFEEGCDRLLGPTSRPRWSYSTSKAVGEDLGLAYHRQTDLPVTVFRPFNTIGPRQTGRYGMVVPRFVQQALSGEMLSIHGDGQQRRSFCDVRDLVRGLTALLEHPEAAGQVFNVGSAHELSILELARTILKLVTGSADGDGRIAFVPYDRAYAPGFEDMRRRQPDLTRIRNLTGWNPEIRLEQTLADVIAYHRR
jgi:UDP-glucose 4-epimerase